MKKTELVQFKEEYESAVRNVDEIINNPYTAILLKYKKAEESNYCIKFRQYALRYWGQLHGVDFSEFYGSFGLIMTLVLVKKDFYMEYGKGTFEEFIKYFLRNGGINPSFKKLLDNENIKELLKFSYESGVSMGDFHSGNIGITPDEKIKIIDFGV